MSNSIYKKDVYNGMSMLFRAECSIKTTKTKLMGEDDFLLGRNLNLKKKSWKSAFAALLIRCTAAASFIVGKSRSPSQEKKANKASSKKTLYLIYDKPFQLPIAHCVSF